MLNEKNDLAIDCCLLAGRLMIESGAETYRVEDTMTRMAISQGLIGAQSYITPTGIIFSLGKDGSTRIMTISLRVTDLERIALINQISRKLTSLEMTIEEAYEELHRIASANLMFPMLWQIIAASIASGCFLILFEGTWWDVPAAIVAGGIGFIVVTLIHALTLVKFFAEFLAASFVGFIAFLAVLFNVGEDLNTIIISGVMPLVPGLLITNAVRDLMAGHFVSGVSKGAEALLTAFAIGAGVALVLSF
ncbi:threonine/serine exporter family protein [Paenisporosarcina indica]|uniref:threonine/serine exporter family protein n=1 Tax=Paenisporosarcina indica TaxID=650093 RepID=UPI00094F6425|nr:threonine/serine exporter family protein [Paenisporosarcina indica]